VYEILAIAAGVLLALLVQNSATTQMKVFALTLGSLIVGTIVSFISGELFESLAYLLFDAAQVLIAAAATVVTLKWWNQRASRRASG
jgi:uncharacterized integral membrane protein